MRHSAVAPACLPDAAFDGTASHVRVVRGLLLTAVVAWPLASAAQSGPNWSAAARPEAAVVNATAPATARSQRSAVRTSPALSPANTSVLPAPTGSGTGQVGNLLIKGAADARSTHRDRTAVDDAARSASATAPAARALGPGNKPGTAAPRTAGAAVAQTSLQSNSEMSMLQLQSLVQQRSTATTLTTNMMSSLDPAMQNVANNIGGDAGSSKKPCGSRCPNTAPIHKP